VGCAAGELTGVSVQVVIAWHHPVLAGGPRAPVPAEAEMDLAAISAEALSDVVAESVDPASQVKVSTTVREGNAADVLLEVADGADLLVLSSRRHGGFAGALLGPVSQHYAQQAPRPVVIIIWEAGTRRGYSGHKEGEPDERYRQGRDDHGGA
jgi:nucleotide-binding universal stress UspA family protein